MKKSLRLYITGTIQELFFKNFVKENADKRNVRGFFRKMEDGRIEIFLEGGIDEVNEMIELCKGGQKNSQIRNVELKEERHQGFKEFKILHL